MVLPLAVVPSTSAYAFVYGLKLPLYSIFRGLFRVEDEFLEISFIDQVLKVLSEGTTVNCEAAHPVITPS